MQSLLRLVNKPRVDDWSPLAKFYYADEALNAVTSELDSFDGRRDPERCNQLVAKLRQAQDRLLHIISEMLLIVFPRESDRVSRDYRIKFPDEIIHDSLPGQLWFGAECLTAGSNIIDHEAESEAIRPMARELTRHLDHLRELLKIQSLKGTTHYPDKIKTSLKIFDHLFAEFELNYVSAMVPVKTVREHELQLNLAVLFSESLEYAIKVGYITHDSIDDCDPNLMVALPRLAIVCGLLHFPGGILDIDGPTENIPEMFRAYVGIMYRIRGLLRTLDPDELRSLELSLCKGDSSFCDDSDPHSETLTISAFLCKTRSKSFSEIGDSADAVGIRSHYRSSADLIHRLFVCIAGVADQIHIQYPSDTRRVLKMVLQPNEMVPVYEIPGQTALIAENEEETGVEVQEAFPLPTFVGVRWVPDADCEQCTACGAPFTLVRRRHHCRNCGRIFCGKCSTNSLALPELGYDRKVRVCNLCFLYKINPFSPGENQNRNSYRNNEEASSEAFATS
ncbi:unnamed protein product [Dracunculus medinensis]|uniref:FYVE-type domain-containing protein n=1 Tax=Dracunculus medinensis TaxID=318479 RepID=A0A0N4U525_DRAME|nr:unnamed protein product [Dracunculus medinensis]